MTSNNEPPVLWIGGVQMPTPSYRNFTTATRELTKSERNVGGPIETIGTEIIYGVGAGELNKHHIAWKYVIDLKWIGVSRDEKNIIMGAVNAPKEKFLVDFIDIWTDKKVMGVKMYLGSDAKITPWGKYTYNPNSNPPRGYFEHYDIQMTLTEL